MVKNYVHCETCERDVFLGRKNFDKMYDEVLVFLILTGVGILIYLILRYSKKPNTCPNCESEFDLNNLPAPKAPIPLNQNSHTHKVV